MNYQSREFEFSIASSGDAEELLELFEDMEFSGDISVLFTRRPDPYHSLMIEGEKIVIPIVRDIKNGKICAMGCCIIRKAFINGEVKTTGYLTSLKINREYKSLLSVMKRVYRFLYDETKDYVDIYYTTILEDNKSAQRLLEKKRRGMPMYKYEGNYTVYCFDKNAYKLRRKDNIMKSYKFEKGDIKSLAKFYQANLKEYNFSPIDTDFYGLNEDDFYTLRDEKGEIVAACALWNQNNYKQYIVTNYSGMFKYISKFPTNLLGYPKFPKKNSPINYASISFFIIKNMDFKIADIFLRKVVESATKYDLLLLGLFEHNTLNKTMKKINHIKYSSRFYRVNWEDEFLELDKKIINLEVGLL